MKNFVSIQLDKGDSLPLYQQLYQQLAVLIEHDKLEDNEKLPPIRKLANILAVNTVTIVNAYKLLEKNNLAYSKVGSGTFVKKNTSAISDILEKDVTEYDIPELKMMDHGQVQINEDAINFASAIPAPELFPVDDFKNILNEVLERDRGNAFGYQESQGFLPLRESICCYLGQNGIITGPDNIQIISGAQQGIDIITKTLVDFGDYVITESPTYTGAIAALKSRGANIISVEMDPDGISIEKLENAVRTYHPKLIYTTPNFQNPTGYCYSNEKKKALLEMAENNNLYIIEDDSFTELSYDEIERYPLKALDKAQRVIYIKSFSKIFMPGLRVAFLVSPENVIPDLVTAKHISDVSTSGFIQRAFDMYLRKDLWKKHIILMMKVYKERYFVMLEAMKKSFPEEISYQEPGGGLTFWVRLPEGYSSNLFYRQCLENDIIITPGSLFYPDNRDINYFRLSFAALYPQDIERGIAELSRCYLKHTTGSFATRTKYTPLL